jgi:hypothetical protein
MTWRDVPLPPAIATMCALLFDAVWGGARWAAHSLADGEIVRTRRIVNRITVILRHVILMIAVRLHAKPPHARNNGAAAPPPPATLEAAHGGDGAAAPTFELWSLAPKPFRRVEESGAGTSPTRFDLQSINRDEDVAAPSLKSFQRKIAGIRDALENPMRYAWKFARALRNPRYLILAPTIPRTTPRRDEREYWDEYRSSADEAEFQYHSYWQRRRDSS